MNREGSVKAVFIKPAVFFAILFLSNSASAFVSSDEYLAHIRQGDSCAASQCHANFASDKIHYPHEPVVSEQCGLCHKAEAYPQKFGIQENQNETCLGCHKKTDREIRTSRSIHGPVKDGNCTSCHDAHGSDRKFFLKVEYGALCSQCHSMKSLYSGEFIHKPVEDGNCGLCHDPHASNFKSRLNDIGANVCIPCHEDMIIGMTQEHVHAPLIQSGCTDCHDPHAGDNRLRLLNSAEEICRGCHEEKQNEISQYTKKHEPAWNGKCTLCHSPHFSDQKFLLLDKIDELCYSCHKESREWKKKRFPHGPVVHGNCTACHNPHGSDNAFILRLSFPHTFYSPYEKGKYRLCFLCHKEALITEENAIEVTDFRNGQVNLHRLHVHQKKGRTCRACHDVHASNLEGRIRDTFPFGKASIPMQYIKTGNGGTCIPGCHREKSYDRVNKVENKD